MDKPVFQMHVQILGGISGAFKNPNLRPYQKISPQKKAVVFLPHTHSLSLFLSVFLFLTC